MGACLFNETQLPDRGTALGAWCFMREPLVAIAAADMGYDYVCVDLQHGLAESVDLPHLMAPLAAKGIFSIARVLSNDPASISRALDAGARGIIVPMINTAAEAAAAVQACLYPPLGRRSFGPIAAGTYYGHRYPDAANDMVWCMPMIETAEALDNLDAILAVPGVRAVYVGPADLSMALGLDPAPDHDDPTFRHTLADIAVRANRANVLAGIHATAELAEHRAQIGYRMITVGYDWTPLARGLGSDLALARRTVSNT